MFNTTGLLVLAALFLGVIMVSNMTLRGLRWDLTENSLYTISEGSKNVLAAIDDPINLYFYYSNRASEDAPGLRNYATRVREMLEEFALHADGKINLQVIDPLPFSEDEDRAAQFGLQSIPIGAGNEQFYLGLAGTNTVDDVETIPFFHPNKETFLEYDVSKLVYGLTVSKRTVVGLLTTLPMSMQFDPATRQPRPPWAINGQIGQLFELRTVDTAATSIGEDVDILMVAHPQNLEDPTLYAIDQFVMRGGKALIFVDPHSAFGSPQPGMPPQGPPGSNLPRLFDAWGIEVSPQVVTDARHALQVNAGGDRGAVRHPGILGLGKANFNSDDVITAQLSSMNIATAGFIDRKADAAIELTPLMTSSSEAMPTPAERFLVMQDPSTLLDGFK
ncbi:MAG: GldG family protein, partial [Gammaproteobacteria bacterium]